MSIYTSEVGGKPVLIGQYGVSIDALTAITVPTTAQRVRNAGVLELILSVETQNARITFDGTAPTTANGILLVAGGILTLRGEETITTLQIIGVAAGGKINYGFTVDALI